MLLRTRLVTTSVFGDVHTRDNAANAMLLLTPQMSTIKTASYSQHDAAAAPAAYAATMELAAAPWPHVDSNTSGSNQPHC